MTVDFPNAPNFSRQLNETLGDRVRALGPFPLSKQDPRIETNKAVTSQRWDLIVDDKTIGSFFQYGSGIGKADAGMLYKGLVPFCPNDIARAAHEVNVLDDSSYFSVRLAVENGMFGTNEVHYRRKDNHYHAKFP